MDKRNLVIRQLELMDEIRVLSGINIVTCGNCGSVILHKTNLEETVSCHDCGRDMDLSDCPDLFYTGMEESKIYN